MKVVISAVIVLLCGCTTTEQNGTCMIYEDQPFVTRENLRYPMEGYIETVEYRTVCVKYE